MDNKVIGSNTTGRKFAEKVGLLQGWVLAALVFASLLSACTTQVPVARGVRGEVVDDRTGQPLAGVSVTTDDAAQRWTKTNENGVFVIPPAYEERTRALGVTDVGDSSPLPQIDLRLSLQGYELKLINTANLNAYEPIRLKPLR